MVEGRIGHMPGWIGAALVALAVLLATGPTLSQLQFSSGMENLNVATVLEIRRTGHWLVPTLEGDARLNKPPLTAWVTTAFVPPAVAERLNEHDPVAREAAYRDVAFRVRLAPLLETCLTILLVAAIGQITFGGSVPFTAAAGYATSLLVLKLGRAATTDVQMTLWIALAQFGIALVLWHGRRWSGSAIAGIATGLALMSKGPVSLLFLLLPAIAVLRAFKPQSDQTIAGGPSGSAAGLPVRGLLSRVGPPLLGTALALAIGLPWFLMVYLKSPTVVGGWTTEVTRIGASENASSDPIFYLAILPFLTPWLPWAIVGMYQAGRDLRRCLATPGGWLLLGVVLPLVVMSFPPDRKDRYALPAMIPLAVLVGYGIEACFVTAGVEKIRRWLIGVQYVTLAVVAVGLPIAGATALKTIDGGRWFSPTFAAGAALAMLVPLAIGVAFQRRRPFAFAGATVAVLLIAQAVVMHGYRQSIAGQSDMKPLADAIRAAYPDPQTVINARRDRKRISVDLAIYLNRATQRVPNWQTLPLTDPPTIAILQQPADTPDPVPPSGWHVLTSVARDKDRLWALVQTAPSVRPIEPK